MRLVFAWSVRVLAGLAVALALAAGEPGPADAEGASDAGPWTLQGQVLGADGQPIAEASIRFRPIEDDTDEDAERAPAQVVRSGEDGRFSNGVISAHSYDVRVFAPGHAFWTGSGVVPSESLFVHLDRGVPLTGRVLDETTGEGIAGVSVRLDDDEKVDLGGEELETTTDNEGRYVYAHAPVGVVWVRASAPGRATRSIRGRVVPAAGDEAKSHLEDIWLPEGGRLSGRIVGPHGEPVPGASVLLGAVDGFLGRQRNRFRPMKTRSDEDGRFHFEGVTAGTRYKIFADSDRYCSGVSGPLTVDAGTDLNDVTVTLEAGARLRLRLIDPEEKSVERLTIRLDPEKRAPSEPATRRRTVSTEGGEVEIDDEGWLTASRLPAGVFTVRLEPVDLAGVRRSGVTLKQGETTDLGTIAVEPGSTLAGRVVDAAGAPVDRAEVVVSWRDLNSSYSRNVRTRADGSFKVGGVPEFPLALTTSSTGFAEQSLSEVRADGEPVVVELKRRGAIRGTVKLGSGGVPPLFSVQAVPARSSKKPPVSGDGSDGAFEIDGLDPGRYAVLFRAPGNARGRVDGVEVLGGGTTNTGQISLETGRRLTGRVVLEDTGAPCPAARIRLDLGAGPTSWDHGPGDVTAISDLAGRFAIDGLEPVRYTLTLDHPEFAPLQRSVDMDPEAETTELELRLGSGGELRGSVTDADGLPVAGVNVFVFRGMRGFDRRMVATLADGSFRVPRLAPGTHFLMRGGPGSRSGFNSGIRTVDVKAGQVTEVDFSE